MTASKSPTRQLSQHFKENGLLTKDPAAVHRMCLATDDLNYSNGFRDGFRSRGLGGMSSTTGFLVNTPKVEGASTSSGAATATQWRRSLGDTALQPSTALPTLMPVEELREHWAPLPALRPVEESAGPMPLETLLQMPRWQYSRRRFQGPGSELAHAAAAAQMSSTPSLPSMRSCKRDGGGSAASPARSSSTTALPNAAGASARGNSSEKENTLGSAARELLEARRVARERRHRMSSTFTDGRRRAALMSCMESIEQNGLEPTLGELSKRLSQSGWQQDEVTQHLLLAASHPSTYKIKSNREVNQSKPEVNYGVLPEIVGMCNGNAVEHTKSAMALRSTIDGFREAKTNPKEQNSKSRRRPISPLP